MSTASATVPATPSASGWSIFLAVLLTVFGFLAIMLPAISSIGMVIAIGWLVIFSAVFQLVHAFHSQGIGSVLWKLLVAVVYLIAGFYLIWHPLIGVASLTLVLASFFLAESVMDVVGYFHMRSAGASGWLLVNAAITLVLGLLIWLQWPSSSLWVIGTLVGIRMIMTGTTRLMVCLAARKSRAGQ